MKQKIVFIITISFLIGFLLGNFLPGTTQKEGFIESLYGFDLIDRVSFNATGNLTEINEETITIEDSGETLSMKISEEIIIFVFPPIGENLIEREEGVFYQEPKEGTIEDLEIGSEINVFGFQDRDSSLMVESISFQSN